jgi:hypothetical protein
MSALKIWKVTFNDGGWHQSLPSFTYVAESEDKAKKLALNEHPQYKTWDCWASEFTIDGFIIEVYDEKTYKSDKRDELIKKVVDE